MYTMDNTFSEFMPDSEEDSRFQEKVISDADVLINEDNTSNGEKSESETHFEFLDIASSSKFRIVSVPTLLETDTKASWTRSMTKALIEEYTIMLDQFRMPDRKQKDLWVQICKRLQEKGYPVTAEKCDRKFRNLKQTFRTIYYSNRSEKNKKRWEFYEDLSVIIPPLPNYSRDKSISPPPSPVSNDLHAQNIPPSKGNTISAKSKNVTQIYEENSQDPPLWFKEFLTEFKASQEKMIENIRKMHNESKQIEIQKIRLLENIISLMNKNKN